MLFQVVKMDTFIRFRFDTLSSKVQVTFETKLDQDLVVSFNRVGHSYTHTWVVLAASPSDKIYGGGEQFTHLNLRERTYNSLEFFSSLRSDDLTYPIWTREQGACPLHCHKVKNFGACDVALMR